MTPLTAADLLQAGEIQFENFRSSGPGGQNINKVSTGVRLRFKPESSAVLPQAVKARLLNQVAGKLTESGEILIEARRFRTQERNRQDAIDRLIRMIADAWEEPRIRRQSTPSKASRERWLEAKRRRSRLKRDRGRSWDDER